MMMLMDDYLKLIRAECECDSLRFAIMFIANCYAFDLLSLSLSLSCIVSLSLCWQPDDFLNTKRACLMRRVQLYSSLFAALQGMLNRASNSSLTFARFNHFFSCEFSVLPSPIPPSTGGWSYRFSRFAVKLCRSAKNRKQKTT